MLERSAQRCAPVPQRRKTKGSRDLVAGILGPARRNSWWLTMLGGKIGEVSNKFIDAVLNQ